jgi:hypothetical protein
LGSSHASSITIPIHFFKAETTWRYVPRLVARTYQREQKQKPTFNSIIVIVSKTRAWLTMSLKLTENTARDFAARHEFPNRQNRTQLLTTKRFTTRAMSYDNPTARCRSLAPVR